MEIISFAKKGDVVGLKKIIDTAKGALIPDINVTSKDDGRTALHYAAAAANLPVMDVLLKQANINVDVQDYKGDTPLHIAASAGDMDCLRLILSYGPNLFVRNNDSQRPNDLATDPQMETLLNERIHFAKNTKQWKRSNLTSLESELPNDPQKLKDLCVDLLITHHVLEERFKEALRQLIEEKHLAFHQNRLLEQAAGIPDKETGERYIAQLQYLQDENERLTTSISYLKLRIQVLETTAIQQEEYYKTNLAELTKQQKDQLEAIFKRAEETEKAFLAYQKKHSEELAKANQLRSELNHIKSGKGSTGSSGEISELRDEIYELRKQLGDVQAEKVTIEQRLKLCENLKQLADNETIDLRKEVEKLRKNMTENVMSQIQEVRKEQDKKDEKDESTGEILFIKGEGGQRGVKAGTMEKLVERLIDPSTYDNQYQQAFLLTHTVFMDSQALLDMIIKLCRENIAASKATAPDGTTAPSSTPMLLRIVNTLKIWVEQYWPDFHANERLLDTLTSFVDSLDNPKLVQMLKTSITRKLTNTEAPVIEMPTQFPKPILPKLLMKRFSSDLLQTTKGPEKGSLSTGTWNFSKKQLDGGEDIKIKLAELDPLEVARQLTLIEFELFMNIKPREFLDLAWMKDDKEQKAPNIIKMVRWSNHVIHWLVTEIVTIKDNVKQRALMMEKIIAIGQHLEKLNNFNGVKEVLAALQSSAVYRLKKTREAVGSKFLKAYEELKKLTSSELNYKSLRAKVHAVEPPLIPFPGVYQGDLVFLETCGKNRIENNLVNFQKFQKIASYVIELQTYQKTPYQLGAVAEIQEFIRNYPELDDDQAYALSLIGEPRQ